MKSPLSSSKEKSGANSSANEAPLQYLYRSFLDAVSVGLWVSDNNGQVKFFNKSWLEFTGRTFEDEINHEWDGKEIHPEDLASCLEIYSNNFKAGTPFEHEYRLLRYDGESRWVHEFVNPYFADDNSHSGFVGTCIDITERKEAILLANQQLREKNKDLEQFAYVASHDLQEPLRKIQSFGELIKTRFGDDVPLQALDYINRMDKAASRMRVLIDDLLTFSRVSSRTKPFVKVELDKEVKGVISDLEVLLKDTQGKVNVDELPVIDADPSQIRQLMLNIINNGLKYHRKDEPPVINISSRTIKASDITNPHHKQVEMVELNFRDNGIGFNEIYVDRIFEPFQRLHGRNEYEGTGIGLAICKKIVERHKGNITAKSSEGKGSEFILQLPLRQN